MAEAATKLHVRTGPQAAVPAKARLWSPFESLRREIERVFEGFDEGLWRHPFWRPSPEPVWPSRSEWRILPAVDIAEKEKAYEITAELPGLDESDIEVSVSNGTLTIRGEKREESEEKQKDYYLSERRYGAFQRSFALPDGINVEKIEASFRKGLLTITLPKTAEAQKARKITVRAA